MQSSRTRGIAAALLAALTFGLTVPLAKAWFSGVGPWLLAGLRDVPASTASLLLTCEGLFTSLLAWIAFREHYDRRIVLGFLAIAAGAVTLALVPGSPFRSLQPRG